MAVTIKWSCASINGLTVSINSSTARINGVSPVLQLKPSCTSRCWPQRKSKRLLFTAKHASERVYDVRVRIERVVGFESSFRRYLGCGTPWVEPVLPLAAYPLSVPLVEYPIKIQYCATHTLGQCCSSQTVCQYRALHALRLCQHHLSQIQFQYYSSDTPYDDISTARRTPNVSTPHRII
eukprot:1325451-Rhodomonas_salina.2